MGGQSVVEETLQEMHILALPSETRQTSKRFMTLKRKTSDLYVGVCRNDQCNYVVQHASPVGIQVAQHDWVEYRDDTDRMPYYVNNVTGMTQWERPNEMPPVDQADWILPQFKKDKNAQNVTSTTDFTFEHLKGTTVQCAHCDTYQ